MPNICIINQFANTPDLAGHTRQYEIANYFSSKGWGIKVFASDFNLSQRKFTKLKRERLYKKEKIRNIEWFWLRVFGYKKNNFRRIINMASFCLNLLIGLIVQYIIKQEKIDLIYASSPQLPAAFFALFFAKLIRVPFIFEVRDLWPQVLIDQRNEKRKSLMIIILKIFEKILYKFADHIVVLSNYSRNYIHKRGGKRISWLPNGPELNQFRYCELPKENYSFNKERPFRIIYTGAHGESNDLENVLNSAKLLSKFPINFILVGDGPEKKKLQDIGKDIKNVYFKDPIPKSEIPSLLETADAVLISLKELEVFRYGISPNKLYDAYAIGRPIISSVEGSINDEIIKYNLGVTCSGGKPKLLSEAIKKLFYLPREKRIEMSKNARLLAERIYAREIINIKLNEIFIKYIK